MPGLSGRFDKAFAVVEPAVVDADSGSDAVDTGFHSGDEVVFVVLASSRGEKEHLDLDLRPADWADALSLEGFEGEDSCLAAECATVLPADGPMRPAVGAQVERGPRKGDANMVFSHFRRSP